VNQPSTEITSLHYTKLGRNHERLLALCRRNLHKLDPMDQAIYRQVDHDWYTNSGKRGQKR
jgi:hypothetical protein